jgi:hypothetical protein
MHGADIIRQVVVFDAADLQAESAFWAGMLDGHVFEDDRWHTVIDAAGQWRVGVQLAPDHVAPQWPDGNPQQVHLDLHVQDARAAHDKAVALGARLLLSAPDLDVEEGHQVYADPAGHPSASDGATRHRSGWRPSLPSMSARAGRPAGTSDCVSYTDATASISSTTRSSGAVASMTMPLPGMSSFV